MSALRSGAAAAAVATSSTTSISQDLNKRIALRPGEESTDGTTDRQ
jgi:hypothetical protein